MSSISFQSNIKTEIKEFLKLAIPLSSAQLAQSVTGFVDTVMMGRLGPQTLAAGGLASLTFFTMLYTASGIVMGVSPLVAQAYGADNKSRVEQVTCQGLWLSLILTIPMMILMGHMSSIMLLFRQEVNTVTLAKTYLDIILWGLFQAIGFAMLKGAVSALSQARPVMMIMIFGTLFNVLGNYVLAFGKLGFPRMELAGLGLSSALSLWFMFFALVVYTLRHQQLKTYKLFQYLHRLRPRILWELLWIGVPIGVSSALEVGLFAVITLFMGMLGTEVLAAHQIVYQTIVVIFMIPFGMSQAATVRVGQWLGLQDPGGVRRAGYVSVCIALGFTTLVAIVLFTFPQQVVGIYLDIGNPENTNVLALAIPMINVAAIAQILDGVQKTVMGSLYGLQDTRLPMLLSFCTFWGVGLTSGYFLGFHFGLGGTGLWIGQSLGVAMAAVLFMWRFWQHSKLYSIFQASEVHSDRQ